MIEQSAHWRLKQAATYIGMSEGFVRKAVRLGQIPYVRIGTKSVRFRKESLDEWIAKNSSGGEVNYAGRSSR